MNFRIFSEIEMAQFLSLVCSLSRRIKEKSIFAAFQTMIIKHRLYWYTEIPVIMTGPVFVV